jgi:hypothetical protein
MYLDRHTLQMLKKYAKVFNDARAREVNESDTVMYLIKFFEDVLGYDSLSGEISKEVSIKDRYCDFGIKLDGSIQFLIEAKSAGNRYLREKDIEQAENYASRAGICWVLLTNGIEWKLFHLDFGEGDGISHDEMFSINLVDEIESNPNKIWDALGMLTKDSIKDDIIFNFLSQKKALSPSSLIKILFSEPVLINIKRELNRFSEIRLEIKDVFEGLKNLISKDALMEAGDITLRRKRKKRKKSKGDNTYETDTQDSQSNEPNECLEEDSVSTEDKEN